MASSPSQAVVKRTAESGLMLPPPPPKRIKRPTTVLDEDTYTDALSHIIARDYFPGLLETRTKQEYLDALDSKDKAWIASAGKRLSQVMTPGGGRQRGRRSVSMTPRGAGAVSDTPTTRWGGDTPASVASSTRTSSEQEPGPDVSNLSLSAFQATYTSEDNESFNKVLDNQNTKRRRKYAWMWNGNKILSARQIAHRQREIKRITGQGGKPDVGSEDQQLVLTTDLDARPAKPDSWKSTAENPLMFIPSSIEDSHETLQQKAEASSRAGPKQVVYDNTRLQPVHSQHDTTVPPSPSLSAIKDAIAGRPRPTDSEPGFTGGATPRVNGYAFVDEDEPDEDESTYEEHLKLLAGPDGSGDSSPNPFRITENRKREDLHHRMVERVARKKRAESDATLKTPVPRFPSSPSLLSRTPGLLGATKKPLTPAAQKLLQKVGSTPRASSSSSSNLRNMWTPTPKRTR
jgi:protein DGCR14